jgi:hypothetical protein
VRIEVTNDRDVRTTTYHTPAGAVSSKVHTNVGRIADGGNVQKDWLIKTKADFAPVISMIDDTLFRMDEADYLNSVRDVGSDGLVRLDAGGPPYAESVDFFGIVNWSYALYDFPSEFRKLIEALERRYERFFPLALESPGKFVALGSVSDEIGAERFREHLLPFYKRYVPEFKKRGKICSIHAHNSNLRMFADLLVDTGVQVIEAYTPPPISNLPLDQARAIWGKETVIWVNFPETVFWSGAAETKRYTLELLESDPFPERLVIGMTEMGTYGISDADTERAFKAGFRAVFDAIDDFCGSPAWTVG